MAPVGWNETEGAKRERGRERENEEGGERRWPPRARARQRKPRKEVPTSPRLCAA